MSLLQWLSAKTLRERTKGYHALAAPGRLAEIVAELLAGPERRRLIEALPTAWRPEEECFSDDVSGNGRLRCNFRAMSSLAVAAAESLEAFSVATSPASLSPFPNAVAKRIVRYTVDAIVAFAAANGPSPAPASIPPDAAASAGLGSVLSSVVDGLDLLAPPRDDRRDAPTFVDPPLVARVLLALRREFRWSSTAHSNAGVTEALSPAARLSVAVGIAMSLDLLAAFLPRWAGHLRAVGPRHRGVAPGVAANRDGEDAPLDLHLDLILDGLGVHYPCPRTMALHPIDDAFLKTMHDAWRAALAEVRRVPPSPLAGVPDPMLARMWRPSSDPLHRLAWRPDHGPLDVRWRIVGALDGRYTDGQRAVPLRGGSLGLAVCGYLARILGCEWTEPNGAADWTGTGVIAEVGTESNPTRFADVADGTLERKVRACFARHRVRRFYVTSRQSGLAENFAANLDQTDPLWPLVGEADDLTSLLTAVRRHSGWYRDVLSGPNAGSLFAASEINSFYTEYVSTPFDPLAFGTGRKPFGGRDRQIEEFLDWLRDARSPRRLLAAPSGRGKSALLLHALMHALRAGDLADVRIAYVPISIRFGTASYEKAVPALAERLRFAIGDLSLPLTEAGVADALARDQPAGRRVLVVLDGIDEAVGWQVTHSLIPLKLGAGVKVFVSARDAETSSQGWLDRLRWPTDSLAPELPPLDAAGLRDVLLNMGSPLDVHSGDDEFLRVLLDLTEGDPLLVRLYVEDLWRTAQGGVAIAGPRALVDAARSGGVRRGLAGYFDRWWDDQQSLWELHSDAAARIGRATRLSDVLSAALGPLTAEDLAQLLGKYRPLQDEHLDSRMILRQWIPDFRRFLTGDGDAIGFSFSHPRLKEHFWGSDVKPEARRRHADLQFAFVAWGDEAIWGEKSQFLPQPTPNRRPDSTRSGAPPIAHDLPEPAAPILSDIPRYLVLHYGEHLVAYPHFTDQQLLPRLARLLDADWCEEWQHVTSRHDYAGFLADVGRAFTVARRLNEAAWNAGPQSPPCFAEFAIECRIELIRSSIRTLRRNIPPEVVAALFRSRDWTAAQSLQTLHEALATNYSQRAADLISALSFGLDSLREDEASFLGRLLVAARSINTPLERARALAAIGRQLPPHETLAVLHEALDSARSTDRVDERAARLAALAESLPPALALDVLGEALADVESIPSHHARQRPRALGEIAARLPPHQALDIARSIDDANQRAHALAAIAERLPPHEALTVARGIAHEYDRARTLAAIAERMGPPETLEILTEALAVARSIFRPYVRASALVAVAKTRPPEEALGILREALAVDQSTYFPEERDDLLAAITQQLPLNEALPIARSIGDAHVQARALVAIAERLPAYESVEVRREALTVALPIDDSNERDGVLAAITQRLPVTDALTIARSIGDPRVRVSALAATADRLPADEAVAVRSEGLAVALSIDVPELRARALTVVIQRLPPHEALALARSIDDVPSKSDALAAAAERLPPQEAIAVARSIAAPAVRARALAVISQRLPRDEALNVRREALAFAQSVNYSYGRDNALADVAEQLQPHEALNVVRAIDEIHMRNAAIAAAAERLPPHEALDVARSIESPDVRARALAAAAERLPSDQARDVLGEALAVARSIDGPAVRARALTMIAERLPNQQALDVRREAREAVRSIHDSDLGVSMLAALANSVERDVPFAGEILWGWWTRERSGARSGLCEELGKFSAVLAAVLGEHQLRRIADAVVEVGRRWP